MAPGGSHQAYLNPNGPPRPAGISFQEPQRIPAQRSGPSRESVKSYGDDKRGLNDPNSSTTALNQVNTSIRVRLLGTECQLPSQKVARPSRP